MISQPTMFLTNDVCVCVLVCVYDVISLCYPPTPILIIPFDQSHSTYMVDQSIQKPQ